MIKKFFQDFLHSTFANCENGTDIFLELFKPCLDNIIFQSNLYATQQGKSLNLTKNEFLTFLGINFVMGYHVLPSKRDDWSTQEDLGVKAVSKVMTRNRFDEILSFLHVNDNQSIPNDCTDKLYKLRKMSEALNNSLFNSYGGTELRW